MASLQEKYFAVGTPKCGVLHTYVQGDLTRLEHKAVFLTVHDIGCSHRTFQNFVNHPCMEAVRAKSVFIHVDVPGQEEDAPDFQGRVFPTLENIGEELVHVLNELKVKYVIGLGEGAGANILVRFALRHSSRCLGLVLIHCTASSAGWLETLQDKLMSMKLALMDLNSVAENYLLFHRYGYRLESCDEEKEELVQTFISTLRKSVNTKNLAMFVNAFLNRTALTSELKDCLDVDCLLVSGKKSSHLSDVDVMFNHLNKRKSALIKMEDAGDILEEVPEKLSHSLVLFCQGLGVLVTLATLPNNRPRSLSSPERDPGCLRVRSMQEADHISPKPRSPRLQGDRHPENVRHIAP